MIDFVTTLPNYSLIVYGCAVIPFSASLSSRCPKHRNCFDFGSKAFLGSLVQVFAFIVVFCCACCFLRRLGNLSFHGPAHDDSTIGIAYAAFIICALGY